MWRMIMLTVWNLFSIFILFNRLVCICQINPFVFFLIWESLQDSRVHYFSMM